jgi:SAM-dependent methyltransferase
MPPAVPQPFAAPLPSHFCTPRTELAAAVGPAGKRVLEVGCGAGNMGASLLAAGAEEVVGIELHAAAAAAARTRLSAVVRTDLDRWAPLPYPDGYFDCITFCQVLEQLADPLGVLAHLLRYLASGGSVVAAPSPTSGLELPRVLSPTALGALLTEAGLELAAPPSAASVSARPRMLTQRLPRAATLADPWTGSRPLRVLLAPTFADPTDRHEAVLSALVRAMSGSGDVTIGVALPRALAGSIPAGIERAAALGNGDLLLFERPEAGDRAAWQRIFAAASLFVTTGPDPALLELAASVGLEPTEGGSLLGRN